MIRTSIWGLFGTILAVGMIALGCGDGGTTTSSGVAAEGRILIWNDTDNPPEGLSGGSIIASYMDENEGFVKIAVPMGEKKELTVNLLPGETKVTVDIKTGGDVRGTAHGEAEVTIDGNVTIHIIGVQGWGASFVKWELLSE